MGRAEGWVEGLGVIAMIAVCLGLTYGAGLAIQFVFDGLERAPFLH